MTEPDYRAICVAAGVLPHEMYEHPELGLCVSPSGLRKLAAIGPDREGAAKVLDLALRLERPVGAA